MFLLVYDEGSIYSPDILDIKPEDLLGHFMAVSRVVHAPNSFNFYATNYSTITESLWNMAEEGSYIILILDLLACLQMIERLLKIGFL